MFLLNDDPIIVGCVYHIELTIRDLFLTGLTFELRMEEAFEWLEINELDCRTIKCFRGKAFIPPNDKSIRTEVPNVLLKRS